MNGPSCGSFPRPTRLVVGADEPQQGGSHAEALLPGVKWCASALEAASGADMLVALTEWNEFRALDLKQASQAMRGNILVDLRNIYSGAAAEQAGLLYFGIGKTRNHPSKLHRVA